MGANLANDSAVGIKHSMQQNYQVQDLYRNISDIELFQEIESMWIRKGSQPITTDIKDGYSKYSLNTYTRRFGGWRNALKEFILYIEKKIQVTTNPLHKNKNLIKTLTHYSLG